MKINTTKPSVGQIVNVRGVGDCLFVNVYVFGTADVECVATGKFYRITGHGWL